jgi:zinc transport system substrate-binding protein
VVVTTHEAFGYLAHRYGLEMVGISGLSPDAEPSPARLADVREVIADEGVTTVFYERLVSPTVAETLADDLGVVTAVLDPIEGLTDDTEGEDYFTLMRANLGALEEANGCT